MCNFGNKDSEWIEEHHANRDTTQTNSYKTNPYLKPIEQPDFRQRISPIASLSVLESEIEKVSGEIESLLGELGHLSDVSDRDSLTPSPRTNMVVQRQHEHQDFAGSLQRPQVLDLSSHSHDIRQHLTKDNQQEPLVANFQQIDQQGYIQTPSFDRVQAFQTPIQHDNYHRQPQFNEYDTAIHSTKQYQVGTNNLQSVTCINRVQPTTIQSQTYVPSPQQVPKPQIGHQPTPKSKQGSTAFVASSKKGTPKASPASTWGQQLGPTYTTTTSSFCAGFLTSTAAASTVTR
ncbi:unnamed protein product [Mytilus edulis]|uniref:Uncharacterized protein n=1 Tax=Mytilus edulis TaxID=6550 RepID=A0A8S3U741_MYTED|nr:unnamed protein product [Mytilus edulis]